MSHDEPIRIHVEEPPATPTIELASLYTNAKDDQLQVSIKRLESKIDYLIGFNYWKRYTASAFWSNLSTPINLAITILTAIMAAHSSSDNFMSSEINLKISIGTLFITTLNTFFRPHVHATENIKCMNRWMTFGYRLEAIYYQDVFDRIGLETKLTSYNQLLQEIYNYKVEETATQQNFVTDLLHIIVQQCCLYNLVCDGKGENWLALDKDKPKPKICCAKPDKTCC